MRRFKWGGTAWAAGVLPLRALAQDQQTSGGLDLWTAFFVLVVLVIALGGFVAYEVVLRTRS